VSTTGSDSNAGTQASPWKTLQHADSTATLGTGGTAVHVADGTYNFSGTTVTLNKGGTSNVVRFVWRCDNQSNVTRNWPCLLRGGDGGSGVLLNGSFSSFDGFDYSGNALYAVTAHGTGINVLHNRIHDVTGTCTPTGGAGIGYGKATASDHDGAIIGNWIFNINSGAPSTSGRCHGIYDTGYSNLTIENNVIFNNPNGAGIKYEPSGGFPQAYGIISNNTFWGNGISAGINGGTGGCILLADSGAGTHPYNMSINNNICYANPGTDEGIGFYFPSSNPAGSSASFRNNLMNGSGNNGISASGGTIAGTVASAPSFVNFQSNGSGDYHLKVGSAGINAGATICASGGLSPCIPATDFSGISRPQGSAIDIGAYEQ